MKVEFKEPSSDILQVIADGLIDENTYFNCVINEGAVLNNDSLVSELANASWDDPASNPTEKDVKRAIIHLSEFKPEISSQPAAIACYGYVNVGRERSTEVELNSNLKEFKSKLEDVDYQISLKDYKDLLESFISISPKKNKSYSARKIAVVNMKEPPACENCGGTGKEKCPVCHGIGKGYCPDCNGKGSFLDIPIGSERSHFSLWLGKTITYEHGDPCPTCSGEGSFNCKACQQTGEVPCTACKATGYKDGATSAQKVTWLKETFRPYLNGEIFLPNRDTMNFEVTMIKDLLIKQQPAVFRQRLGEASKPQQGFEDSPKGQVAELFEKLTSDNGYVGVNFLAYSLPQVRIVTFTYDSTDYSILIIGRHAFAKDLPSMTLLEGLFKSYKKKIG